MKIDRLTQYVKENWPDEYACHIQFVVRIARQLAAEYCPESIDCVIAAAILHDIGRDKEQDGETHAQAGARLAKELLAERDDQMIGIVVQCILHHNRLRKEATMEEKVVFAADSLSKLKHHEEFMLLCRKKTRPEKAKWAMHYLEKSFRALPFPELIEEFRPKYELLMKKYRRVLEQYES